MTLALASMSSAGSSASACRIFMLDTMEPVISFKANIASSAGGLPVNYRGCFVFTRVHRKGVTMLDSSSSSPSLFNFKECAR